MKWALLGGRHSTCAHWFVWGPPGTLKGTGTTAGLQSNGPHFFLFAFGKVLRDAGQTCRRETFTGCFTRWFGIVLCVVPLCVAVCLLGQVYVTKILDHYSLRTTLGGNGGGFGVGMLGVGNPV